MGSPTPCPAPLPANLQLEGVPMDIPDGWFVLQFGTYSKRHFHVTKGFRGWFWYSGRGGEVMGEVDFDDPVACMVACELENGGCTDGHN